ncbi:Holocytochrome c-c1 synthase [Babesia duncani]|uniref:Holocytochrome c-type synthase n=1 Tax=Babesia duncani TaxID=323732 RepID=A0AAD9UPH7_9APIC|nr:Holocytochrome c-c1 synthase [Babesia duncani]
MSRISSNYESNFDKSTQDNQTPSDGYEQQSKCSPASANVDRLTNLPEHVLRGLGDVREESSIPSRDKRWLFPSERQFYKSTVAKGHRIDASLIPKIVKIHNAINEKAWEKVMEYESLHDDQCDKPVLSHFIGKQDTPSLRARFNTLIGYKPPYDRHDWTVDRCGKQIRYIIDFYEGQNANYTQTSMYIDARPALTFGGIIDRFKLWIQNARN